MYVKLQANLCQSHLKALCYNDEEIMDYMLKETQKLRVNLGNKSKPC